MEPGPKDANPDLGEQAGGVPAPGVASDGERNGGPRSASSRVMRAVITDGFICVSNHARAHVVLIGAKTIEICPGT